MNNNNFKKKCVICRKPIEGYGHNPFPVWPNGRCCDRCNTTYVIPMRMMLLTQQREDVETKEETSPTKK